jgi:hypothetical protein
VISHEAIRYAARTYAKTLVVCTTGAISLSATATGYARAGGSFVDDGFAVGMELVAAGFGIPGNNGAKMIVAVSALSVDVTGGAALEGAANGRSLTVGLPSSRSYENLKFTPAPGVTHISEQYLPGPAPRQVTWGPLGELELLPMYVIHVNVPAETGEVAAQRYGDSLLALFAPRRTIPLANGDLLRVRSDVAPFPGQLLPSALAGFAVLPLTIPFRIRTNNSI